MDQYCVRDIWCCTSFLPYKQLSNSALDRCTEVFDAVKSLTFVEMLKMLIRNHLVSVIMTGNVSGLSFKCSADIFILCYDAEITYGDFCICQSKHVYSPMACYVKYFLILSCPLPCKLYSCKGRGEIQCTMKIVKSRIPDLIHLNSNERLS